jgi:hypothetical protein
VNNFVILIGSYARGDFNQYSDCDVFRVGCENTQLDYSALPISDPSIVSLIDYDNETFVKLYKAGSLFLYHVLYEGVLISGDAKAWQELQDGFVVQRDFTKELEEIFLVTEFLSNIEMFGGKFLTPLVNAFTELKNACVFYLAHQGIYTFEKSQCFRLALSNSKMLPELLSLKIFYDHSVRGQSVNLPFDPNSYEKCASFKSQVGNASFRTADAT